MNDIPLDISSPVIDSLRYRGVDELSRIFAQFRTHIRNLIQLRLDRRIAARLDASDIVQETYLRACQGLERYLENPQVPPVVWLRAIGKQLVAEAHRKQFRTIRSPRREVCWDLQDDEQMLRFIAESTESVRTQLEKTEAAERIRENLKNLSSMDREIIEMRHVDGLSLLESAEALDVPLETAKKRYQRALQRFRQLMQPDVAP